jgi:cytochrome c-type biogenesis protein
MNVYASILIPLTFGLIGFIEPCSLGINIIFLDRIKDYKRAKRISETLIFSLVRGLFLALVGLSAAFIGSKIITLQSSFFWVLGGVYVLLGVIAIMNMYVPIFKHEINLSKYIPFKGTKALGFVFGLIIPACAISLVLALIGKSVVIGNLLEGFISLFTFGIALSFPLLLISCFEKSNKIIKSISEKARRIPWLAGFVLIVVGLLTMLSSTWWGGAAG